MRIGVPTEIKNNEFRVAIPPSGVHALPRRGHEVTGGASKSRERVKVVSRGAMTAISRSTEVPADLIGQPEADRVPERVADRLEAPEDAGRSEG